MAGCDTWQGVTRGGMASAHPHSQYAISSAAEVERRRGRGVDAAAVGQPPSLGELLGELFGELFGELLGGGYSLRAADLPAATTTSAAPTRLSASISPRVTVRSSGHVGTDSVTCESHDTWTA